MSQMVLHVDGSVCRDPASRRRIAVAWAVVAHFNGQYYEAQGALGRELNGSHELLAVVEGVLLAHARGYGPQDVAIYTDDLLLANAGWYLHPGNYKQSKAEAIVARLRHLTRQVYSDETHELVLRYLRDARLHWVKGHSFCVEQERADYLAKHAAWSLLGRTPGPLQSFEQWLDAGISYYEDPQTPRTWYAPFAGPPAQQLSA